MSRTRPQRRRNDAAFGAPDCLYGNLERQSMTIRLNGALSRCLAGSALGGTHRLRLRSLGDGPMAAAAVGSRVSRRDRTESRGERLRIDRAAPTPAGDLYRRRQRRPGRLPAPHHRREKRADSRKLPRVRPNVGTRARRARRTSLASPRPPASADRGWAGHSPTRPAALHRRNLLTAVQGTCIFQRLSARTGRRQRR